MQNDGYSSAGETPSSRTWPWIGLAALALALVALSFVPEWLTHHRELRGEGYRSLFVGLTAWQLRSGSLPVIGGAVIVAAGVGLASLRFHGARRWAVAGLAVALGLLAAGLVPLAQVGHISRLWIGAGWSLVLGIGLVAAMAAIAAHAARPGRRVLAVSVLAALVAMAGGTAIRFVQLHLVEGPTPNWSEGTHERVDGAPGQLVLADGTFSLGRWSGTMEPAGINVILTADPACPEARGFYRVRTVDEGVLWELVVDVCADGARAAELEGVWRPAP
jgi:hypothetical protein